MAFLWRMLVRQKILGANFQKSRFSAFYCANILLTETLMKSKLQSNRSQRVYNAVEVNVDKAQHCILFERGYYCECISAAATNLPYPTDEDRQ